MKQPKNANRLNPQGGSTSDRGFVKINSNQPPSHLSNQLVELPVAGPLHLEPVLADVEHCVVVHEEGDVGVLHGGVGGQHGVVGLHHRGRGLAAADYVLSEAHARTG